MLIRDILNNKGHQVYSIEPDRTVYEAIEYMADKDIGALLVLKEDGKLAGIITERDYRNKIILKGRTSKTTPVEEIMSTHVVCVTPTENVETCMALMTDQRFRHLPVVDERHKVTGIISIGDLVKAVIAKQQGEIHDLRGYISGAYPA